MNMIRCVFQKTNIFVTRAACDRQFLKKWKNEIQSQKVSHQKLLIFEPITWRLTAEYFNDINNWCCYFFVLQTYAADIFFAQEHSYSWPAAFSGYISSIFILLHCWINILQISCWSRVLGNFSILEIFYMDQIIGSNYLDQIIWIKSFGSNHSELFWIILNHFLLY